MTDSYQHLEVTIEELEYWQQLIQQIKYAEQLKIQPKENHNGLQSSSSGSLRESS
jgi:hypothetical protein